MLPPCPRSLQDFGEDSSHERSSSVGGKVGRVDASGASPRFPSDPALQVLTGGFDASGSTPRVPLPFRPTLQLQALTGGLTHLALPPACHNAAVCNRGGVTFLATDPLLLYNATFDPSHLAPLVGKSGMLCCCGLVHSFSRLCFVGADCCTAHVRF